MGNSVEIAVRASELTWLGSGTSGYVFACEAVEGYLTLNFDGALSVGYEGARARIVWDCLPSFSHLFGHGPVLVSAA